MNKMEDSYQFKRGLTVKNRIMMAPMTTKMSFENGEITLNEENYYSLRSGEVGAVITGAANVQDMGKGWEGELSVANDEMHNSLSQLAAAIKRNGTKAILQIFHAGRMTNSKILRGEQPVSASGIAAERANAETPREMTNDEILQLIEDFSEATKRAIKAGFDGVELHGANTYLLQQFFSPHSNRRTDSWGGSLEKRFTFIKCLVEAVTKTVDDYATTPFIVGYRFSPEEYENPGISFADTLYLVEHLCQEKLDYLHVSLKAYDQVSVAKEYQEKTMLAYIQDKINGRLPLVGVGGINTSKTVNEALAHAELLAVGSALLIDPHWTSKLLNGKEAYIKEFVTSEERRELFLGNGVWQFMKNGMPDKLK